MLTALLCSVLQCSMSATVAEQEPEAILDGSATASQQVFNRDVGLSEAVSMTGRNKSQISRDTNAGKLLYTLNGEGHKRYQVSDLYQLYGFRTPKQQASKEEQQPQATGDETAHKIALLEQTIKSQSDTIRLLEKHTATLEQTITRLLPAPQPAASTPPAEPKAGGALPAPKTLWQRIFGT